MTATAAEAVQAWLSYMAEERRSSPRTLEAYGDAVRRYIIFLDGYRGEPLAASDLGGVRAAEFRAYLASRRKGAHPLAPRSISQVLSAVRNRP